MDVFGGNRADTNCPRECRGWYTLRQEMWNDCIRLLLAFYFDIWGLGLFVPKVWKKQLLICSCYARETMRSMQLSNDSTLPETKIAPFGKVYFQGAMLVLGRVRCVVSLPILLILLTCSISMHRFVTLVGLALLLESLQRQMALAEGMVGVRGQVGIMHIPSTTYNLHTCSIISLFPTHAFQCIQFYKL